MTPDFPATKKSRKRESSKDRDKDRDPNAPKKPANAFLMYCQQQRTVMQDDQKDPNIGHHELTKSLAKEWKSLATDDKKVSLSVKFPFLFFCCLLIWVRTLLLQWVS